MTPNYTFSSPGSGVHSRVHLLSHKNNGPDFCNGFVSFLFQHCFSSITPAPPPPFTSHKKKKPLTCNQNGVITAYFDSEYQELTHMCVCVCVCPGLVPEPTVQRETHEAAERAGRQEARVLPQPEADEDAGGPAGARGAHPQRALLLLRRCVYFLLLSFIKERKCVIYFCSSCQHYVYVKYRPYIHIVLHYICIM